MNTTKNKNQIGRIVDTLINAYRINPDSLTSDNEFVKETTYQEEITDWVSKSLLNPDEKLAEYILPILVDRFEDHLNNCEFKYDK